MIKVSPGVVLVRLIVEEKTQTGIILAKKGEEGDGITATQVAEILELPEAPEREETKAYSKGMKVIISQDSKRTYEDKAYGKCVFVNEDSIMGTIQEAANGEEKQGS